MLNLNKFGFKKEELSLKEKWSLIFGPDIYIADNLADYITSIPKLKFPIYKGFPWPDRIFNSWYLRSYILINNVGIDLLDEYPKLNCHKFQVHDDTAEILLLWNDRNAGMAIPAITYEEAKQKRGLQENDWLYSIFFMHLIGQKAHFIINVEKHYKRKKPEEKETLLEKIQRYLPNPEPIPELGY